ncbi:MAG: NAD(P)/FAD-dependent oxidoreductase [Acidobacteria bacterium]|nr:MAG: NAD(P)/FAD-dependent oxidoreductase [Acidobacteriota bacterium]TDI46023.1 MAG: NAD(P)/FAD-dependent oxidoreductase [Acidobacteriota bacterium]
MNSAGTAKREDRRCIIIGGGPAGLTAALELSRMDIPAVVFEADAIVGGIAQTGEYKGYRYDIGGHRFFTKVDMVQKIWEEILGDDLVLRSRLSRIYYNDKFFDYPLRPMNALMGLGLVEATRILLSYVKARIFPSREERNFEQWVSNRFGWRLYEIFFKTYTEKVWGMPCTEIGADWAAQRIKNMDLLKAVKHALFGEGARNKGEVVTTLIDEFHYPRLGPGMMWDRCREILARKGYETIMETRVVRLRHDDHRILTAVVRGPDGVEREEAGSHFLSSMPMRTLLHALDPSPPPAVLACADKLKYRDFITVMLIIDDPDLFPDNWIYIHSPEVKLGRIQNFKNWSPDMVPDPARSALGLEYFVQEGDGLWTSSDADLIALGARELAQLDLVPREKVLDGCVVRMPKAYPVYDQEYKQTIGALRDYLTRFPNLQLMGRNGQHRYNNQDHSMVTAVYAARNIGGADLDVWDVNVEEEYHEEVRDQDKRYGDRAVPQPLSRRD